MPVSLSSEVLPELREYERFSTTTADAYLAPRLSAYLERLAGRVGEAGLPAPLVMQSSGGVIELQAAARAAASCVLSGPAGGVVGAAFVAAASGYADVLSFDMGGTSTDVAPIVGGAAQTTTESIVAGVPIRLPMVDVHTVSAGGGSIARADSGGALRVGPRSAGAEPGPAAYGQGGEEPTVTDANLFLGYLADGAELGGQVTLRRELAEAALERVGAQLGLDALETARGVVRVANAEMVRALRVISVERGSRSARVRARRVRRRGRHARLRAGRGAGDAHDPRTAGGRCAERARPGDLRSASRLRAPAADAARGCRGRRAGGRLRRVGAPVRPRTSTARAPSAGPTCATAASRSSSRWTRPTWRGSPGASMTAHEQRYGYRMDDEPSELVNLRVVATVEVEKPRLHAEDADGDAEIGTRRANVDGEWEEVPVLRRAGMGVGYEVEGPVVVEFAEATCVVHAGWAGSVDETGTLVLERGGAA